MKREIRKIYRAWLAFYKNTSISMVQWSFERIGFRLNSDNLMRRLTIDPTPVLGRLDAPELLFEASLYILSNWIRNDCSKRHNAGDSGFLDRQSLRLILLSMLMRPSGNVLVQA
jgi:hypothetical protein